MNDTTVLPTEPTSATGRSLDLGSLPELLGFHLRLANVAVYRDFTASLSDLDLTQKQCAISQTDSRLKLFISQLRTEVLRRLLNLVR